MTSFCALYKTTRKPDHFHVMDKRKHNKHVEDCHGHPDENKLKGVDCPLCLWDHDLESDSDSHDYADPTLHRSFWHGSKEFYEASVENLGLVEAFRVERLWAVNDFMMKARAKLASMEWAATSDGLQLVEPIPKQDLSDHPIVGVHTYPESDHHIHQEDSPASAMSKWRAECAETPITLTATVGEPMGRWHPTPSVLRTVLGGATSARVCEEDCPDHPSSDARSQDDDMFILQRIAAVEEAIDRLAAAEDLEEKQFLEE